MSFLSSKNGTTGCNLLIMLREYYFVITVMQIIGYELDTAMNIEFFRPKLMKKSLILLSKFDRQS